MFLVEAEEQTFSLKPMNCPESTYIYRSRVRSYRELPLRLSEYGVLHRNELSGVLSGLTRVRHFVTDDAHIYVTPGPDRLRDPGAAWARSASRTRGSASSRSSRSARGRTRRSATQRCGRETEAMMREALEASGIIPRQAEATARSTRPRSTSRSRTRWDASGRRRRSRSTA